jgi:hypothetical protein
VTLLLSLGLGLLLRLLSGRSLADLSKVRLRGESVLVCFLVVQAILPAVRIQGGFARVAFLVWLSTFPALMLVAWLNRKQPGMLVVALGLLFNFAVVAANGGMPVMPAAVLAAGATGRLAIPVGDFVHILGGLGSRALWLADSMPFAGPAWLRGVPSAGDCLLCVGVAAFLAATTPPSISEDGLRC